jgi:hypothetical protein
VKTFLIILLFHICCLVKAQEYVYNGVQQYESVTGNISMKKVIKDDNGNYYIFGTYIGTVDFDNTTGVYNLTATGFLKVFVLKLNSNRNFIAVKSIDGVGSTDLANIKDVVIANNQLIVAGGFSGSVDFDPSASTNIQTVTTGSLIGNEDFFIAKYTLDFDPSPTTTSFLTGSIFSKNYILKLDNNLNYLWVKDFGKNDYGNNEFVDFDIDQNGNLFSVSRSKGIVDMDPSANNFYLTPLSVSLYTRYHVFIQKLTNDGLFSYAVFVGNTSSDYNFLNDIFVSSNEIVGVGEFDSTIDLDPNTSNYYLTNSNGQKDAYFMRLTENTLSIADFSKVQSQVYPNPTTDFFRVSSSDGIKEVAIYALDGKLIFQKKYNETSIQIPVHEYSKGIYMITILNSNDTLETKKIIIN